MAVINAELNVKTTTGYDQINLKTQSGIVTYDNTTSGLASTTTKGAIDELRDADNIKYNNAVSGLIATDVQGAVDEVNNTLTQFKGNILWTNPSPSASFVSQTITLSSSDYDELELFYKLVTGNLQVKSVKFLKSENAHMDFSLCANATGANSINIYHRALTRVSDTSFSFSDAYNASGYGYAISNINCIPLRIRGIKY